MKTCSICKIDKDDKEFSLRNKKLNQYNKHCKACQKIIRRKSYLKNRDYFLNYEKIHAPIRRKNNQQFITEYKTNKPCADCKKIYPSYVMDFDHLPQFKKEFQISRKGQYYSKEKLLEEFSKCELVCANCHRERTWRRKNGG